jgi:hypothetical protein
MMKIATLVDVDLRAVRNASRREVSGMSAPPLAGVKLPAIARRLAEPCAAAIATDDDASRAAAKRSAPA